MFAIFKKLFSKSASPSPATPVETEERIPAPAPTPAPALAPTRISTVTPRAPEPVPKQVGDRIALPLNEILARLPTPLPTLVLARPGGTFSFSASVALEQLRTGAVRIPFAQLRQGSPPGTFADNAAHDDALIDLPLHLVLAAIGPSGLSRRTDQKRTEVPDEVTGVFEAKKDQLKRGAAATPVVQTPPTSPKTAPAAPVAPVATPPSAPKPVPPAAASITTPTVAKQVAPVLPAATAPKPTTSINSVSTPAASKPAAPLPFATTRPAPPPSTVPAPPAVAPVPTGDTVVTTLQAVSAAWPEPVRHEIQQFKLENAFISIPLSRLEAGMKIGRVVFTWAELCGWLNAPMPTSANGESSVELPLRIVAPLFLAAPRAAKTRKVVSVGDNVPDLFAGLSRPVEPQAVPEAAPAVAPPFTGPTVLAETTSQPSKLEWTPDEIMQRILALPGVRAGLLGSSDGLLVAGRLPAPLNAETMAAFLPQIFRYIAASAEEVQLGKLHALKLSAGQGACAIFKAGALYLAVLSQREQTLPEPALEQIAIELAQANP